MGKLESRDEFLETLSMMSADKAALMEALRGLIQAEFGFTEERIRYGGIVFGGDAIGIFPRKRHVTVEFGNGTRMSDPYDLLEGTGKTRRHITLLTLEEIEAKHLAEYVRESRRCADDGDIGSAISSG